MLKSAQRCVLSFAFAFACFAAPASAVVTEINTVAVEPFANGAAFGDSGTYERVRGTFKGELDPADARNQVIVNLDKAPRNARGRVEYEADFFLLRPADAARGNHRLIYDVTNRGRKVIHWRLMDGRPKSVASANDPKNAEDAGNGLFLRRGYTLVWSGWDSEAPRASNGMSMSAVIASDNGKPIVRAIRDEIITATRERADPPKPGEPPRKQLLKLYYDAATLDQSEARLTMRRGEKDARVEIPAARWAYANARAIELLPAGTNPEHGVIYEFHYKAKDPRVLGVGLAATRDLISFLRAGSSDAKGNASPLKGITGTLAFGASQSGRFLRDFVYLGFNQDESARKVFDGVYAHTAGAGGVFLNYEFGQPNRTSTQHEDHTFPENVFPFSAARVTDPVTGKTDSMLRNDGFDPLWMETNTSTEYWQKGASLTVTDPLGQQDLQLPPNARAYLFAGTQHAGAAWQSPTRGQCVNPRNPQSPTPAQRALLIALDEWSAGTAPPATRTPTLKDKTFTTVEAYKFPAIPGIKVASRINEQGVLSDWVKPVFDVRYPTLITQINADGNEIAGIQLPEIAVPLATHTGWNEYAKPHPEGELCDRDGTYAPFAATRAERAAKNDPRPSLEERYGDHAGYVKQFTAATEKLVAERLLLREDADLLIARAKSAETAKRFGR